MEEIKNLLKSFGVEVDNTINYKDEVYTVYLKDLYMLSNFFFDKLGEKYVYTLWYNTSRERMCITLMERM